MQGYQQAHRISEPKDKRMLGYEVTSKHTPIWGYEKAAMQATVHETEDEDVRMWGYKQASTHEHKGVKMWGCEDINKSNISNI